MEIFDFTTNANGFCWTTTPYDAEALRTLPFIELKGYQQDWSAAINSINNWLTRALEPGDKNPYAGLYLSEGGAKAKYKLPYFTEYHHGITQNWAENKGPLGSKVKQIVAKAEQIARSFKPAAGVLTPRSYEGAGPNTYSVSFYLINTYAGAGAEIETNILKNQKLIESLIKNSLHDLAGALTINPPLIYEIFIPGVRWSPAAVISNLMISNKGTLNLNRGGILGDLDENYIYPDAWEVNITITELISESRRLYKAIPENYSNIADVPMEYKALRENIGGETTESIQNKIDTLESQQE